MKTILVLIAVLISINVHAQWPGAFYTFELIGADGKNVDSTSIDYKLIIDKSTTGPIGIDICTDNKIWRFYKGDNNLSLTNSLIIEKMSGDNVEDKMIIKFPPPMTGGEHKHYDNLYVGTIKFKSGTYKIRLPKSREDWDGLNEKEYCPDGYNFNKYLDISAFQKH